MSKAGKNENPHKGFTLEKDLDFLSCYEPDFPSLSRLSTLQVIETGTRLGEFIDHDEVIQNHLLGKSYSEDSGVEVVNHGVRLEMFSTRRGQLVMLKMGPYIISRPVNDFLSLRISEDKMTCTIKIKEQGQGGALEVDELLQYLFLHGVCFGYNRTELSNYLLACRQDKELYEEEIIAARGQPYDEGSDGSISLQFKKNQPVLGFMETFNCHKGAILAIVENYRPSQIGIDVTGEMEKEKKKKSEPLSAGQNVMKTVDLKYRAEIDGVVTFSQNVINVFPMYVVPGDVGATTGNIHYMGCVNVKGQVQAGFQVKAAGGIFVHGSVEGGTLESGHNIVIQEGLVGANNSYVKCQGNLKVGYIQNAHVECLGNVQVRSFITHSHIEALGSLNFLEEKGRMVGGHCSAYQGVEGAVFGTPSGTATEIKCGILDFYSRYLDELAERKKIMEKNLEKLKQFLQPFLEKLQNRTLEGVVKKKVHLALLRYKEVNRARILVDAHENFLYSLPDLQQSVEIGVNEAMFPGVKVCIGQVCEVLENSQSRCKVVLVEGSLEFRAKA
jgi:uncharacterized protein (DUF342 family)